MIALGGPPGWRYGAFAIFLIFMTFFYLPSSRAPAAHMSTWVNKVHSVTNVNDATSNREKLNSQSPYQKSKFTGAGLENFEKPKDYRIVAMIMAGRREFLTILDCYLRRNLVSRGGWLDEVYWIIRTDDELDIAYLEKIISEEPEYTGHPTQPGDERMYMNAYKHCRNDTLYIKIDDDVVFWEDHAIPAIIKRKLEHPEYAVVSANVINQPALSWVHYHLNTQHPYMPEMEPPTADFDSELVEKSVDWRASSLPPWKGDPKLIGEFDEMFPAPFKGHRWLPLPKEVDIELTPVGILGEAANYEYSANNSGWHSWAIAAQTHYSFFQNLEKGELWRYKFDLWDYHYDRLSINFLCFAGKDIIEHPVTGSDEHYLTVALPKRLQRHAVLDGTALTVHYGFHRQVYGHGGIKGFALNDTDALARYRSYANENICGTNMPPLY